MCIPFITNFPSFQFANLLLRNKDYDELASLLAIAPDDIENISTYHDLAAALLDAKTHISHIEKAAIKKLKYCAKNGYKPAQQRLSTIQSGISSH